MNDLATVLYVEDNEGEVELLLLGIERYGLAESLLLDIADCVEEAKAIFDFSKHIAALIDWNLPDGEGTEVAQFIRDRHPTFPILFLTAALTDELLREAEKYNPKGCLEKDYSKAGIDHISFLLR